MKDETIIFKFKLATRLFHPAVEGIEDDLIAEFDNTVRQNRVKQTIGHMVRQIMEHQGYQLDQQNVL